MVMLDSKLRRWPAVNCTAMPYPRDCWQLHLYRCERLQAFHSKSYQLCVLGVLWQYQQQVCFGLHCNGCVLQLCLGADNEPTDSLFNSKMLQSTMQNTHCSHRAIRQAAIRRCWTSRPCARPSPQGLHLQTSRCWPRQSSITGLMEPSVLQHGLWTRLFLWPT